MANLIAKFARPYTTTNKRGEKMKMYVYHVFGTTEDLATFEQVQGQYYRTEPETGQPIWHTPQFYGDSISLVMLKADDKRPARFIADTSHIAKAESLLKLYGNGKIADAIANAIAQQALGTTSAPVAQAAPQPPAQQPPVADDSQDDSLDNG